MRDDERGKPWTAEEIEHWRATVAKQPTYYLHLPRWLATYDNIRDQAGRDRLVKSLRWLATLDEDTARTNADVMLLAFINDREITSAYWAAVWRKPPESGMLTTACEVEPHSGGCSVAPRRAEQPIPSRPVPISGDPHGPSLQTAAPSPQPPGREKEPS